MESQVSSRWLETIAEGNAVFADLMKQIRAERRIEKIAEQQAREAEEQRIQRGINFELVVIWKDGRNDFIQLEGYRNASLIWSEYRNHGHSMGLYNLELLLDGKKVQKVKFIYK